MSLNHQCLLRIIIKKGYGSEMKRNEIELTLFRLYFFNI